MMIMFVFLLSVLADAVIVSVAAFGSYHDGNAAAAMSQLMFGTSVMCAVVVMMLVAREEAGGRDALDPMGILFYLLAEWYAAYVLLRGDATVAYVSMSCAAMFLFANSWRSLSRRFLMREHYAYEILFAILAMMTAFAGAVSWVSHSWMIAALALLCSPLLVLVVLYRYRIGSGMRSRLHS